MSLLRKSLLGALTLLFGLLLSALPAKAAADSLYTLSGKVMESRDSALLGATVSLLKADGKLLSGAITARDGSYRLRSIPRGSYTLRVSFVGFKTHSQTVRLEDKSLQLPTILLVSDGQELSEVKVIGKTPDVQIKGDTIEYNAANFTTNQGAVVADLIKKLPGATVDDKGQITINGKTVSQIMVDGKRFFEGDPKVALNNLPAEVVQKVQVLDRESETSRLSGFSDGNEETVINLTIQPGKKKGLFGTAYIGGGTDKRYEGNITLSRFADDNQFTILGSFNNTNNAGFSDISQDLSSTSFMRGLQGNNNRRGPAGPPRFNANGILTSKVLGGNIHHTFTPKLSINGNALLGNSKTDKQLNRTQQNYLAAGSTTESGRSAELNDKDAYAANLRIEWKPDSLTELIFMPELRIGHALGSYFSSSLTREDATGDQINSSDLSQSTLQDQLSTSLRMELSRRLNSRGRTITLSSNIGLDRETGEGMYQASTDNRASASTRIDQRIQSKSRTGSYRARLGWVEPLGAGYFTQLTYQINGSSSRSSRDAFDADAAGAYSSWSAAYSNEFQSSFLSHQAGLALKKKGQGYDLTAGINVTSSQLSSHSIVGGNATPDISRTTVNYSPTLRFSYKPQRGTELHLNYFGRSFQPTNEQLSPVQDVTNPLLTYVGNPDLLPGFQHNLFGRFSKFWSASQTSLSFFGHARLVQNDIISRSTYDLNSGARTIDYTNVDGNASAGFGGFLTQALPGRKFSIRLGSFNDLSRTNSFINGDRNRSLALRLRQDLTLNYRHQGIDMNLRGVLGYYNASNTLPAAYTPATKDYSLGYTSNIQLPLGFAFEGEATYTTSRGYAAGFNQDQWLLNAGLSYSFLAGKKGTLRLKAYDLLDARRSVYREITAMQSVTEESNTLGRYVMMHFIYRFDSFSGGGSRSDLKQSRGRGPMGPPPF